MSLVTVEVHEEEDGEQVVVTRYKSDGSLGTVARISADANWLHFITDDHEGAAMIHIEALPAIRRALARIARQRKAKP